jgi:hypothetical protein
MVRSVDLAKLKKLVRVFKKVPHLTIPDAMKLAKYSDKKFSDCTFQHFLLRTLPGGLLNRFRALLARDVPPPKQQRKKRAINNDIKCTPPRQAYPPLHPAPNHHKMMLSSTIVPPKLSPDNICDDDRISMPAATTKKCKQWNCTYYINKKSKSSQHNHHENDNNYSTQRHNDNDNNNNNNCTQRHDDNDNYHNECHGDA